MTSIEPRGGISVLLVDDDADIRMLARMVIEAANDGLVVSGEASSGNEALAAIGDARPAVVVLDQMMPDGTGLETASEIHSRWPDVQIVLFSAYMTTDLQSAASKQGIRTCLAKTNVMRLPEVVRQLAAA